MNTKFCVLFSLFFMCISHISGQEKLFEYDRRKNSDLVIVRPTFETSPNPKKEIGGDFSDSKAIREQFNVAIKVLSSEQIKKLKEMSLRWWAYPKINEKGKIVYLYFTMKPQVLNFVSEKDFKRLYDAYKEIEFDMTKFLPNIFPTPNEYITPFMAPVIYTR